MKRLLISFVGPSGSGKSTCFEYAKPPLQKMGFLIYRCDVAYPLRLIQKYAHQTFGLESPGDPENSVGFTQDGQLLAFLAGHFEGYLGACAKKRIEELHHKNQNYPIVIVNTDCRNNAYPTLQRLGFVFIEVSVTPEILAKRRKERGDKTPFDHTAAVEQYNLIRPTYRIENNGTKEDLKNAVENVILKILNKKEA